MCIKSLFRFVFVVLSLAFCAPACAGLATVGAVHDYVREKWDIDIPYKAGTESHIVNMKYLMQLVDAANLELNGWETTDYAKDATYAISAIASDAAARDAVNRLIEIVKYHFFFTSATTSTLMYVIITPAGTFYIDWGDGTHQRVKIKTPGGAPWISHNYTDAASNYEIGLGGKPTAYSQSTGVMTFELRESRLKSMRGCIGCVFPTLPDGSQPSFVGLFTNNSSLSSEIPENFLDGIHGEPRAGMFNGMFNGCSNIVGRSARIDGKYLYELWPDAGNTATYGSSRKLDDYACIPTSWGGAGTKEPGTCEPATATSGDGGD